MSSNRKSTSDNEEIDLGALFRVFWSYKYLIAFSSVFCGFVAAYFALTATPIYRAEAVVIEVHNGGVIGGASMVGQLGGLASLAGVNLTSVSGAGQDSRATLKSRLLVSEFIESNGLLLKLFPDSKKPPTSWLAVNRFRDHILAISEDTRSGLTTVTIDWTDPAVAAQWANAFVQLANDRIRARAQEDSSRNIAYLKQQIERTNVVELQRVMYNIIETETKTLMLANARAEFAFKTIDPAVPPEVRISPWRTVMVLFGVTVGFAIGVLLAFLQSLIVRWRNDAGSERA